jgi:DNA-binding NtrC family response regulator
MSKRILSVSYDESLLATRQMLLEKHGYTVTSALGFTKAIAHCRTAGFDLFILGHSIAITDKQELIKTFRNNCPAPILSLGRVDEQRVPSDFHIVPDKPEELIQTVSMILDQQSDLSQFMSDSGDSHRKPS